MIPYHNKLFYNMTDIKRLDCFKTSMNNTGFNHGYLVPETVIDQQYQG